MPRQRQVGRQRVVEIAERVRRIVNRRQEVLEILHFERVERRIAALETEVSGSGGTKPFTTTLTP